MPPPQRPHRVTARITVDIEEFGQLAQVLCDSLTQIAKAAAPVPTAPAPQPPSQPVREPVQPKPASLPPNIEEESLLLDTKQVAKLLNIGERPLWRYWNSGRVLKPIKIGNTVR